MQQDQQNTKLQIIESSCLFNKRLNHNNTIDGTNIIYLAGSSIVFHNIFQNKKIIVNRISNSDVVGLVFYKANSNMITALAIKNQKLNHYSNNQQSNVNKSQNNLKSQCNLDQIHSNKINNKMKIQIYQLGKTTSIIAEFNENVKFIDMEFMDRKRIVLLAQQKSKYYFYILEHSQKPKRKEVPFSHPQRFINRDRRIYLLGDYGMRLFQIQFQSLYKQLKFPSLQITDYAIIDNEFEIILSNNKLYCYHESNLIDQFDLVNQFTDLNMCNQSLKVQARCIQKVGRNILVAYKSVITLSHIIFEKNKFKFINNYQYKQKIKGTILSMQVSFDEMHLSMAIELIEKDNLKIQNFMFNLSILSSQKKFINPFIRLNTLGTENGQVSSFQGVIPFDTYYLVGNTIINYSYNEHVEKKFKFTLHEAPKQITIHPLGYQIMCVFETQIKFYLKIQNQIVQIWTEQLICSYAKYTEHGMLILACLQDNFYQLYMYDTNSFKMIKSIPNVLIKYPIFKIQLAKQDTEVILYMANSLSIYQLKTGEKLGQFKGKKQNIQIVQMYYNSPMKTLLVYTKQQTLMCYRKYEQIDQDFKLQKAIKLKQQLTCIQLNHVLETVFMGTKSGKIIWTKYPFTIVEENGQKYLDQTKQIYLSRDPISQIFITKNLKFLFISFQNEGMNILRIKKTLKYNQKNRFQDYDISNLNFVEASSKNALEMGCQKLKVLLQKRKTVFNDLQEYKKEWELKKNKKLKQIDHDNKFKQLQHINYSLKQVERLKKQKTICFDELNKLQEQTQTFKKQKQQKYLKEILLYYEENGQLKCKKQRVLKKSEEQFQSIQQKCKQNLYDINKELKGKFNQFIEDYEEMKSNLILYQKRLNIEKEQAHEILIEILSNKLQKLNIQQINENKKSNQLKALITKYKKQKQRFMIRKFLLESKKSFFTEQSIFNKNERADLIGIKDELDEQLKQLQLVTNKKQRRLKKYFKQNQILMKYQMVHNNLITNLDNEMKFINEQKSLTSKNIITIQKQLSEVAELNEVYEQKIIEYRKQINKIKNRRVHNQQKIRYLTYVIEQMSVAIDKIKVNLNEQNKADLFGSIYKNFYIDKKLEKIIKTSQSINSSKKDEVTDCKIFNTTENKKKIIENMKEQKQYLEKNIKLFEIHYNKTNQQMNLNYLRYQTQNYNLIAECNVRKEQTNQKKRILHELIDQVKETQLEMNEMQRENFDEEKYENARFMSVNKSTQSIPFIAYKKNKQDEGKFKVFRKQESDSILNKKAKKSSYQVRKMLEIQKLSRPYSESKLERKIKTAMLKNRNNVHVQSSEFLQPAPERPGSVNIWKKPFTATGKRHNLPFGQYYNYSRGNNKSNSKPTTCTTYTNKNKTSVLD